MIRAGQPLQLGRERRAGQRAGGQNRQVVVAVLVQLRHFLTYDGDVGLRSDAFRHAPRELHAIHGKRMPCGNGGGVSVRQQHAAGGAHLLLQQPRRGVFALALQRVGAHKLGKVAGLVRLGRAMRPHLEQRNGTPGLRRLQRSLRPGKAAANHVNVFHRSIPSCNA